MARGLNKFQAIGRLGMPAETRSLDSGSTVASFNLAIDMSYKDSNGNKIDAVEWITCEAWNGLADVVSKYTDKGSQIYIEGVLKTDTYEKDGEKRYKTKIRVRDVVLLGGGKDNNNAPANEPKPSVKAPEPVAAGGEGDELPF